MMGYVEDPGRNPYAAPKETGLAGVDEAGFPGYASFWARFAAMILDALIVGVITLVIRMIPVIVESATRVESPGVRLIASLLRLIVHLGYYAGLTSSASQATLGKQALGIKVTDLQGRRISFGRALGRELAKILSFLTFLIGYIMAAFTERRQALHDMIAGTLVVKAR